MSAALPRNDVRVPPIQQPTYLVARDRARREFEILNDVVVELAVVVDRPCRRKDLILT
jgi:hypothetical protein